MTAHEAAEALGLTTHRLYVQRRVLGMVGKQARAGRKFMTPNDVRVMRAAYPDVALACCGVWHAVLTIPFRCPKCRRLYLRKG